MLSPKQIARYRAMTPGQRLAITLRMTRENLPLLNRGSPELVRRRHELLRRENESHALALLAGLLEAERYMQARLARQETASHAEQPGETP